MQREVGRLTAGEFWDRVRLQFTRHYLEFREESAVALPGRRTRPTPPSVVGPWAGRTWEVGFQPPRRFYPDIQVGFTTAVRLVEPARMPSEPLPWLYVGERPRVFSQNAFDFDRIIMRYRRREGNFKGSLTGDPELDRRWGVYPYEDGLGDVFREPKVRQFLKKANSLSPRPKTSLPSLAVFGTEATLTLPTTTDSSHAGDVVSSLEGFSHVLERLEEVRGLVPARQRPILMDVVRDERGTPFPVPRFECPVCHVTTHPRYQTNLEAEVCEKCGKSLYLWK